MKDRGEHTETATRLNLSGLAPLLAAHLRVAAEQESAVLRMLSVSRPHLHDDYLAEIRRRAELIEVTYRKTPAPPPSGSSPLGLAAQSVFEDICAGRLP